MIGWNLQFFPALRDIAADPLMVEMQKRTALRLQIMREQQQKVWREPLVTQSIARLERALNTPSIEMPAGLTREQKHAFITKHADKEYDLDSMLAAITPENRHESVD